MDREINKETRVIDRSTMKRSEYITWHLFYIIVALVLANRLLFVTLPRLSAIQSRLILVFAIILISLVFSIPRWKRNRTQIAVIEDVIIGLGMYIITAYWRFYKNWFTIIIIILSFTTFIVSVCVWLPKYKGQHIFNIENRCTKKRVFKSRFLRMSNLTSLIITVCMLILSGPIIYNKIMAFIGHPDTGVNQLAELIASSIGRGYSIINLAGIHTKDTAAFTGTSKIYENARSGLLYERIKEAGIRGTLIIENYDLCDSEIRNILVPIIENKKFFDQFVEVEMDLSNMMVIVICSDIKDIPMSLRANMRHIYFQDAEENEIIETINKIIVPRYCSEYGIAFPKRISDECCRTLIYKFANMDMNKLDDVIRSVIVKTVTKGGRKFSDSNIRSFNEFGDYDKIRNAYVRDITAVEHKFFTCYDEYPKCICNRAIKLFEILNWGSDESQKEYARDVIHYIANIFMGETKPLVVGSVIEELNKTHYLQNGFGEKIEAAILSKELEKNTNKMMIIGLNGSAGTGKSTTAVSIAAALQRNFIKINVGGAGGAEIIKGMNKTVHNAGPSMIVKELAKSGHGCYSDVIILDEVDKAEPGFFNALYEFLDPNEEFIYDQYLECHIPKNNFLVVLTFNDSSCIPLPIKDRMEIVEYSNYSIQDKKMIVANYILPKLKKKFGIGRLTIDDDALDLYAYHYDVIPGMRSAERDFEFILMSIARSGSGRFSDIVNIDKKLIMGVLGKMRTSGLNDIPPCSVGKFGMAQALAITSEGIGVSTAVETVINPYQEKNIVVTGLLEGSCLESVSVACCFVNNYIQKELPKLHIHMTDAVRKLLSVIKRQMFCQMSLPTR